jgi:phage-related protein (TIGR01555 family)
MSENKSQNLMARMMKKADAYANALTGLGGGKDKGSSSSVSYEKMSKDDAETLFAADDVADKIVNILPIEMMREGYEFSADDAEDKAKLNEYLSKEFKRLRINEKTLQGLKDGRLYGGASLVFGIKDGATKASEPVKEERIKEIEWVTLLNMHDLEANDPSEDLTSEFYGLPDTYTVKSASTETGVFHASRSVIFNGKYLPKKLYESNGYWHDSVLNKPKESIKGFSSTYEGLYSLLGEMSVGVFKIKGLAEMVANGKGDLLTKRLNLVDAKKSYINSIVIDADAEEYTREDVNFGGLPPVLDKISQRISTAAEMPHTKLFGDGASGSLGGGGESELKEWYDFVASMQQSDLKPKLLRIASLILAQTSSPYRKIESLEITFNSLTQVPDKDKSEIRLKTSQADMIDINMGILTADEVAVSRYGGEDYSINTELSSYIDREGEEEKPSTGTLFNGAQVTSIVEIVSVYKSGQMDKDGAVELLTSAFGLTSEAAEVILGQQTGELISLEPAKE